MRYNTRKVGFLHNLLISVLSLIAGDDVLPDIYELPSHIFYSLVTELPPLALHKLEAEM